MRLAERLSKAKPVLLKAVRCTDADFIFYIVSGREMEKIRRTLQARPDFRGREARKISGEKEVNVLAFPEPAGFPHPEIGKKMLGEVYLNRDFGGGGFKVLGPLFIHGFLHLLGYEHWKNRDTIKMKKLEKKLWRELTSEI